ncbi:phospholipase/carboxylesterase [Methyloparacoccus murrellii]
MSDERLPAIRLEPVRDHRATIIWLHGLGADGHDFAPVATELRLPAELGVRFILPHAPERPVTVNGGYRMRAWYDIVATAIDRQPDRAGIEDSREAVTGLIDAELASGIPAERILVAGFSQGGVIALETVSQHQDRLGGAIALSCYLGRTAEEWPRAGWPIPVFLAHGREDGIVPLALGQAARNTLQRQGYAVEWHEYPMPHSVCREELEDIRAWLLARLA